MANTDDTLTVYISTRANLNSTTDGSYLFTTVTDRCMLVMAARAATGLHEALQAEVSIMKEREVMSRMMAVCVFQKAGDAKIIVFAVSACDHLSLLEIYRE